MADNQAKNAAELGHEPTAVSERAVSVAGVALFGVILSALLLMAGLGSILASLEGGEATVRSPGTLIAPPAGIPTLDANQTLTLRELRAKEKALLTGYQWVDREAGVARIPIDRAMQILAKQPPLPPPDSESTDEDMAAH